jgi:hypothetical protein
MTTTFTFSDGSESITIKTGERFSLEQDINGLWGYTSNKGYNSWENEVLPTTKAAAKKGLRELEKVEVLNARYA